MMNFWFAATVTALCLLPACCFALWKKKYGALKPLWLGVLGFFAFAAVAEWFFSYLFMGVIPFTRAFLTADSLRLVVFSCFMAGIFEETGRLWIFKNCFQDMEGRDAAAGYAIGHFGVEIIILTLIPLVLNIPEVWSFSHFAYCLAERLVACLGHTALSTIVWEGVCSGRKSNLILAVLIHALCDAPLGLYNYGYLGHFEAELAFAFLVFCLVLIGLYYRRKLPVGFSQSVSEKRG